MIKSAEEFQKWMDEISTKEFEDAKHFTAFSYENKEFDNIPQILPRFLFHLHSQIKWVQDHLLGLSLLETTRNLRDNLESQHGEFYKEFTNFKMSEFDGVKQTTETNMKDLKELKEKVNVIKENQDNSGALELQNMMKGPDLSELKLKMPAFKKKKKQPKRKKKDKNQDAKIDIDNIIIGFMERPSTSKVHKNEILEQ